jgi:hypothetical protein
MRANPLMRMPNIRTRPGCPQLTERPKSLLMSYDVASTPSPTAFGLWIASMRREAFRALGASRRDPKFRAASVVLGYQSTGRTSGVNL